jgi:hypothetical protein
MISKPRKATHMDGGMIRSMGRRTGSSQAIRVAEAAANDVNDRVIMLALWMKRSRKSGGGMVKKPSDSVKVQRGLSTPGLAKKGKRRQLFR